MLQKEKLVQKVLPKNNSNQYNIPYDDIPRGIDLSLKNSDRHRTDAEILAKEKRYNSAIPFITLAVEELGKALWLSEYFENNSSILNKEGRYIFRSHKQRIQKVLDYVENIVKQRTLQTREQYSEDDPFHIPEEFDDQDFKKRMWYVDYQKIQNSELPWKKQPWKNPLYVEGLDSTTLMYKYFDLWRCAYHGIRTFRRSQLYNKIVNALSPEEISFVQIRSYIEKHFLLDEKVISIGYDGLTMDIDIIPIHPWVTSTFTDIIKKHIQKKYEVKKVHVNLDLGNFMN